MRFHRSAAPSTRLQLFLASVLLGACFQKVDTAASSQAATAATDALVTQIDPSADPIELSPTDAATASDPCDKTRQDKTQILTAYCARCHSGAAPIGLPPWDFVLDDQRLVTETWVRAGQPAARFVVPGDPDHSALYQRMAVAQDMPPQPTDLGTAPNPKPSAADHTVIREWILNCLGATAATGAGGSPSPGTGGASGASGASGSSGGRGGAAGSITGTGGRRPSDAGTPHACGSSVTAGGSCAIHGATCALGAKVCTCELYAGGRQWVCK
ncbi:MAG: hypothetical protein ACJ8F1_11575 [Polyangia bacterium]